MKVLSIDIDAFFDTLTYQETFNQEFIADMLEIYPKEVLINKQWDMLYKGNLGNFEPNNKFLEFVCDIVYANNKAKFAMIDDHHEILDLLEEGSHVINIDAHHDISYQDGNRSTTIENWVLKGFDNNLIVKYDWVSGANVMPYNGGIIDHTHTMWKYAPIGNLRDFDLIVVCKSMDFTPRAYWDSIPLKIMESFLEGGGSFE